MTNGRLYFLFAILALAIGFKFQNSLLRQKETPARLNPAVVITKSGTGGAQVVGGQSMPVPVTSGLLRKTTGHMKGQKLVLTNSQGATTLTLENSTENSPALFFFSPTKRSLLQAGVHGNGTPFILVSDYSIRTFGLGRLDGEQNSPLLIFRQDDVVRMLFGLSMTDPHTPAFLTYWSSSGERTDVLGQYCDRPDRVCTQ